MNIMILESFLYVNVVIFMSATFIIGFAFDIVKIKFIGIYMTIPECREYGHFKSYITLYIYYVLNTWLFIIFLPARLSQLLIKLTKIKK